jgi:8-oxo-dGTP pyrophosphatase MutT (NUDIX family)
MAKVEQAGAVIVRSTREDPKILLVTARRNPENWIFPKGHVEAGEKLEDAAIREAREEAGVDGTVVGAAGSISFEYGDNNYRVHYFVVMTSDNGSEQEGRRARWCKYKQAMKRLTYDETKELLREAWPRIQSAVRNPAAVSRKKK